MQKRTMHLDNVPATRASLKNHRENQTLQQEVMLLREEGWTTSSEKQYVSASLMSQAYWGSTLSSATNSLCDLGLVIPCLS